ncbi:DAK2 domain fusion protein YloV [Nocardioides luteus]|uniref:Dihydroxyacetone kinase n=1 Tax=Nocardioides luteus TaxID=1844 RepID=A0ABQ5SUU3_9ACTN|nr:DAK2 domain-containing protein [Nocardioides luteus]MDR7309763.1 DAK2 domain fusion protein YloV [Nocardioides luteus]GGR61549.1 dihydroxyacetone kinase [Nocardioides luteus]GLJ67328.1 dihydroxyacetone kinase [Nocardioides luteus]
MAEVKLDLFRRFGDLATDALASHREEIDALNVFPVPDSDTGTNLYLTIAAARDRFREYTGPDWREGLRSFARGALLGARGNSGVILAEMIGALLRRLVQAADDERTAAVFADALRKAANAAYAAVGDPQEGTMLSVLSAAAGAAETCVEGDEKARTRDAMSEAAAAAREALARTPEQLPTLSAAGVVDAGGRGICVLLDAFETALTGRRPSPQARAAGSPHIPIPIQAAAEAGGDGHALEPGGPSYEVMYLLDAEDAAIPDLRKRLQPLGDSLVVVGGEGIWNVHVHVDDVGAAIEAGISAGRPHRIHVTHFAEQIAGQAHGHANRSGRAVITFAAGPGLAELFRGAGAIVIEGGPRRRPTTSELLEAITASGASEVIVLPNDAPTRQSAEAAARTAEDDLDINVAVIPTRSQVQGLAAIAVHEPGRKFDKDVLEMTATARHARHGAVTISNTRAITMAGPCMPGDALGVLDGDFVKVGPDLETCATYVLARLIGGGGELVTLVSGLEDPTGELAQAVAAWLAANHPAVDVMVYDGGQERYPLLMSVE